MRIVAPATVDDDDDDDDDDDFKITRQIRGSGMEMDRYL